MKRGTMKKIGIITINDPINYGNRLQNYAMQIFLEKLGYDVKTIPNRAYEEKYPIIILKLKRRVSRCLKRMFPKLWSLYKAKPNEVRQDKGEKEQQDLLGKRMENFCKFNSQYMKNHDYVIDSPEVPKKIVKEYDYFVAGSDQIWNPKYGFGKYTTYLQFAPKCQRIAIAPSFGIETIPKEDKALIAKYLKRMQYISVREESGKRIVKELTGLDCDVIMDPTLLVGAAEWDELVGRCDMELPEKYVLTYFLGEFSKEREQYIKDYAEENHLQIIHMNHVENPEVFGWGPEKFLKAMKNCDYFFTDSFHGCVFSILFHKQFAVFHRKDSQQNMFGRIETLLTMVGLMKCVTDENEKLHEDISLDEYQKVVEKLEKKRSDIIAKIKQVLK